MAKSTYKTDSAIAEYKTLIKHYLELRPSGTRIKLAEAFGTHKSFISQVCNPVYNVPLPAQHVPALFSVLHLTEGEQSAFLEAYYKAHPEHVGLELQETSEGKTIQIKIPAQFSTQMQRELEAMITDFAERAINLAKHTIS